METKQQIDQRRLAGAGRAGQRQQFAGLDAQVQLAQRRLFAIAEADVAQFDANLQRRRAAPLCDFARCSGLRQRLAHRFEPVLVRVVVLQFLLRLADHLHGLGQQQAHDDHLAGWHM